MFSPSRETSLTRCTLAMSLSPIAFICFKTSLLPLAPLLAMLPSTARVVRGMLIASAGREGGAFKSGPQSGMQRAMKSTMGQARCSEGSGVLQKLDASAARAQRRVRAARARTHEADPGPGASGRQVVAVGRAAASACCGARAARARVCALPA